MFFHLEHWERIFNGFGHLTSGITQELIAIVMLAVVMVAYFVYLRRAGDEARVPTWVAVAGIVMAVVLVIVMGHSYMMASLPAWDSVLQIASLLGARAPGRPATMALICAVRNEASDLDAKANLVGQAVNVVLVVAYLIAMRATAGSYSSGVLVRRQPDHGHPPDAARRPPSPASQAGPSRPSWPRWPAWAPLARRQEATGRCGAPWAPGWRVLVSALALRAVFYMTGVSIYPVLLEARGGRSPGRHP